MPRPSILKKLRADHRRVLASLDALEREVAPLRPASARTGAAPARQPRAGAFARKTRVTGRARAPRPLPTTGMESLVATLARQFATHMNAEEESLFPSLAAALPETSRSLEPLSAEHAELRAILASLAALLAVPKSSGRDEQIVVQWRDFAALLRIHIRKEEALVFNVAEHALPPRELARVEALRFPRRAAARLRPNHTPRKVVHP